MKQLYQSHRTIGYEIARTQTDDGKELVILQTALHKQEVAPAHMLRPLSPQEAALEIRVGLAQIIERARFLGIDAETMSALLTEELSKES